MPRKSRQRQSTLRALAFHEAGHAIVAIRCGLSIEGVSLRSACTIHSDCDDEVANTPAGRRSARRHALFAYAGLAAERLVNPDATVRRDGAWDYQVARSVARTLFPRSSVARREYLVRIRRQADRTVRKLREPLAALAHVLMRRPKMPGEEVEKVVAPYLRWLRLAPPPPEHRRRSVRGQVAK